MDTPKFQPTPRDYFELVRVAEVQLGYIKEINAWLTTPDTEIEKKMQEQVQSSRLLLGRVCAEQLVTVHYQLEGEERQGFVVQVGIDSEDDSLLFKIQDSQAAQRHEVSLQDIRAIEP